MAKDQVYRLCVVIYCVLIEVTANKEKCVCVRPSRCPSFTTLSNEDQKKWRLEYACQKIETGDWFDPENSFLAKNYICCNEYKEDNQHRLNKRQLPHFLGLHNNFFFQNNRRLNNIGNSNNRNEYDYNQNHYPQKNYNNYNGKPTFVNNEFIRKQPIAPPVQSYPDFLRNAYTALNPYSAQTENANSFGKTNLDSRCSALTNFPIKPETGCCGTEAFEFNGMVGNAYSNHRYVRHLNHQAPSRDNLRDNALNRIRYAPRLMRSSENDTINITLESRISGGKTTELEQYPWTVLLKTKFDFSTRQATFNCGGSLISPRYVLTAAHCLFEKGARVVDIEIYLAEFDKRTFPVDCVTHPEGRKCITNIIVHPEQMIIHPEFDDKRLQNDIALIRLNRNVPYTDYTRPICLPTVDIDSPDLFNLRLSVTGWGRNGRFSSDVKQSTVVNLVPQKECRAHYPHLTKRHLCAAGYTGEDTCKGDSGGPLMMVFQGKYYVSGVVSGKRADSPCGTSVPSLYTNVFHYLNWIGRNIGN